MRRFALLPLLALAACPPASSSGSLTVTAGGNPVTENGTASFTASAPPLGVVTLALEVRNEKATALVLDSVTIEPLAGTLAGEFAPAAEVKGVSVAAGGTSKIELAFRPVASGKREAKVTLAYDSGSSFAFTASASGADNATLSPVLSTTSEWIVGKKVASALVGAMVAEADGTVYLNLNANEWSDRFAENVALARLRPDGTLAWLKEWNESYEQLSPDPGQNAESGGAPESMVLGADGFLYVVGQRSQSSSNSLFQAFVLKVAKADGGLVWAKGLTRGKTAVPGTAAQSLKAYAVDATLEDRVVVTGQVADSQGLLLFALKKEDGSLLWAKEIDVYAGAVERGYSIVVNAAGDAYVGGLGSGTGLLLKVTGVNGTSPAIDWVQEVAVGVGANLPSLALDAAGNPYAALDLRGAASRFAAARFTPAGAVSWAKVWEPANNDPLDNAHVVRVSGEQVLVGGRVGFKPFDLAYGDGMVVSLASATGAWRWGGLYYTGKGDGAVEHRVKGVAVAGDSLFVLQQGHPAVGNADRNSGYWYQTNDDTLDLPGGDGSKRLADLSVPVSSKLAGTTLAPLQDGTLHDLAIDAVWLAGPADVVVDAAAKRTGSAGHTHALVQKVKLTEK